MSLSLSVVKFVYAELKPCGSEFCESSSRVSTCSDDAEELEARELAREEDEEEAGENTREKEEADELGNNDGCLEPNTASPPPPAAFPVSAIPKPTPSLTTLRATLR
jgi:hypothetical protein